MTILLFDTSYTFASYSFAKELAKKRQARLACFQSTPAYRLFSPRRDITISLKEMTQFKGRILEYLNEEDAVVFKRLKNHYQKVRGINVQTFCDQVVGFLEELHNQYKFSHFVMYNDIRLIHFCASVFAKNKGIRCYVFELGTVRPSSFRVEEYGVNGRSKYASALEFPSSESKARRIAKYKGNHRGIGKRIFFLIFLILVKLNNFLSPQFKKYLFQEFSVRRYIQIGFTEIKFPIVLNNKKTQVIKQNHNRGKKKVLIALQLISDSNFYLYSDYENLSQFIYDVLSRIDCNNFDVCIRPHPLSTNSFEKWDEYINSFSPDSADAIVTINSTLGFEYLGSIPVYTAGKCFYSSATYSLNELNTFHLMGEHQSKINLGRKFKENYECHHLLPDTNLFPDLNCVRSFIDAL